MSLHSLGVAIDLLGGQAALGKAIGATQQAVSQWVRRGRVPADKCVAIEAATRGQVRCEDLRPDVPWHVVRGQRGAAA